MQIFQCLNSSNDSVTVDKNWTWNESFKNTEVLLTKQFGKNNVKDKKKHIQHVKGKAMELCLHWPLFICDPERTEIDVYMFS